MNPKVSSKREIEKLLRSRHTKVSQSSPSPSAPLALGFPPAFPVDPLQSRVNGLARPVKRHSYLGGFFASIQESIKLNVLIDSPSARPGFHFFAFGPAPDFRETPNLFTVPATLLGSRPSSSAIALSDFDDAASSIKRRSSATSPLWFCILRLARGQNLGQLDLEIGPPLTIRRCPLMQPL